MSPGAAACRPWPTPAPFRRPFACSRRARLASAARPAGPLRITAVLACLALQPVAIDASESEVPPFSSPEPSPDASEEARRLRKEAKKKRKAEQAAAKAAGEPAPASRLTAEALVGRRG